MKKSLLLVSILSLVGLNVLQAQEGELKFVPQVGMSMQNQTVDIGGLAMKYQYGLEAQIEARYALANSSAFTVSAGYKISTASKEQNNGHILKHESRLSRVPLLLGVRYDMPVGAGGTFFVQPQAGIEWTSIRYEVNTDLPLLSRPAVHGSDMHVIPVINFNAGFEYLLTRKLHLGLNARVEHSFWNQVSYSYEANFRSSWFSGQNTYKTSSEGLNLGIGLRIGYTF